MENDIVVKNGWYDISDLFFGKKISDKRYQFISAEWLDTCGDDEYVENAIDESDIYAVSASIIDLKYENKNYKGSEECFAEYLYQKKLSDSYTISDIVSKADALRIIQNFIDKH